MGDGAAVSWRARGLLFENCSCQTICPGHVHFDQSCTLERCVGYWALSFADGEYRGVALAGRRAVIAYDAPRRMIDGDWTQTLILDDGASDAQVRALEAIFDGSAGGPWSKLAPFVGRRVATQRRPIEIVDEPLAKRVHVPGILRSALAALRGRNPGETVRLENMFNQIHAPMQVLATGETEYDDGAVVVKTRRTHGLWSRFEWSVGRRS